MPRTEPLEPEVAAALAAIDATLAGEPVEPAQAELAELALILRAQRAAPAPAVAASLDERVRARSEKPARLARRRLGGLRLTWLAAPVAALAALALVIVVVGGGSGSNAARFGASPGATYSSSSSAAATGTSAAASGGAETAGSAASATPPSRAPSPFSQRKPAAPSGPPPSPSIGHRQVVQSARVALSTTPARIDAVAQEVFDVIDGEHGIVSSSHVSATGNAGSSADFRLSVPESNLQRTMSLLSQLRGAHVLSRSDDTTDITGQVGGAGRRLAEARALRRALLRQLAAATTTEAIASLTAQLHAADAAIGRDASALNGLHQRVQYSQVTVTIQASSVPPPVTSHGGGFTLHRALHDAGRVLVVVAGVALIALAVLVPVSLIVGLVAWVVLAMRRRRREAALDLV